MEGCGDILYLGSVYTVTVLMDFLTDNTTLGYFGDSVIDWETGKLGLDERYVTPATDDEEAALKAALEAE